MKTEVYGKQPYTSVSPGINLKNIFIENENIHTKTESPLVL